MALFVGRGRSYNADVEANVSTLTLDVDFGENTMVSDPESVIAMTIKS